jgi:hypothetical protein
MYRIDSRCKGSNRAAVWLRILDTAAISVGSADEALLNGHLIEYYRLRLTPKDLLSGMPQVLCRSPLRETCFTASGYGFPRGGTNSNQGPAVSYPRRTRNDLVGVCRCITDPGFRP